ncbi:MAG: hypothetical protein PHU77_09080, partial [Simplicispira sp.]|nr:hypothetical protein [Simplicispira sp.]
AFNHLLNFVSPAAAVALLLCGASLIFWFKRPAMQPWWAQVAINFILGCAVLGAGAVWGGRDGKMLTYTALVLACASCQWVLLRGWRD